MVYGIIQPMEKAGFFKTLVVRKNEMMPLGSTKWQNKFDETTRFALRFLIMKEPVKSNIWQKKMEG